MNAELIIFLDQCKEKEQLKPYYILLNDVKRSWDCWSVCVYVNSNDRFQNFLKVNKSKYTVLF